MAYNENTSQNSILSLNPQKHEPPQSIGFGGWLGLYLTGATLFFLLLIHIWLVLYGSSQPASFERTLSALRSPFVRFVEIGLLLIGLTHGLTGLRRILLDLDIFHKQGSRYLTWGLVAVGGILSVWGLRIFMSFPW